MEETKSYAQSKEEEIELVTVNVEEVLVCWVDRRYKRHFDGDDRVIEIVCEKDAEGEYKELKSGNRYPAGIKPRVNVHPRRFLNCSPPRDKGEIRSKAADEMEPDCDMTEEEYVEHVIGEWKSIARQSLRDEIEESWRDDLNNVEIEWVENEE